MVGLRGVSADDRVGAIGNNIFIFCWSWPEAVDRTFLQQDRGRCGRCGRLRTPVFFRGVRSTRNTDIAGTRPATPAIEVKANADLAQKCSSTAQPSRQRTRVGWPALGFNRSLAHYLGQHAKEIRGSSRPFRAFRHHRTQRRGNFVRLNDVSHRTIAITRICQRERACGPDRGLTRSRPQGKVGHARQLFQPRFW